MAGDLSLADVLVALRQEFRRGRIHEAHLTPQDGEVLDGLCDHANGAVYVDPAPAVVSTLIHELIHRRFPRWGERRVLAMERRIQASMTPADVRRWYRRYQVARRKLKAPVRSA